MDLSGQPLALTEFLAIDVETNGRMGADCELTEVGAVLVGGGELHERFDSVVRIRGRLGRGIQRFTGITQQMVDEGEPPEEVLEQLCERLAGRAMVAHSARFDVGVLRAACEHAGVHWPEPPVLCTVALARRLAPLANRRKLAPLAESLGIDVLETHRALPDAETCARVFCALFGRLCANAHTLGDAIALLRPARRSRARPRARNDLARSAAERLDFGALPDEPGVYLFRDQTGTVLYVGKSKSLRARARAHFAPGAEAAPWTAHAAAVDHRETNSELGALLLENRLVKQLRPAGNVRLKPRDGLYYLRCRFDIPFPVLEVAPEPAPGHAISVGPLRGRASAVELMEQLNSLFGLRHCGRALRRREHPSAYGQMGRCLSPCLGDLDPNLYRRRLDEALALFDGGDDGAALLLAELDARVRTASAALQFERAQWLHRRRRRIELLVARLGGVLRATHAAPRLVLAPHPETERFDAVWIVGGRAVDWCPLQAGDDLAARTAAAVESRPSPYLAADEIDEVRIVSSWLAANPDAPSLSLADRPSRRALQSLVRGSTAPPAGPQARTTRRTRG